MKLKCSELDNLLGYGPVEWFFVDDLIAYRYGIHGPLHHYFCYFISRDISSGCQHCLFIGVLMAPRKRMSSE